MKKILYTMAITVCAFGLAACNSCSMKKKADETKVADISNGWVTIFDGTSFDGWRGYNKEGVPPKWTLQGDGTMKINTTGDGKEGQEGGGDLMWNKKLKNFEFEIEWMSPIEKGGNSGIFYFAQEIPGRPIYTSALEYQLGAPREVGVVSKTGPGSLFDVIAADPQNANPAGEWNKARIVVNNGHVEHWQNDVKVLEFTLWTPEWRELLNNSKFSEAKWPEAFNLQVEAGGPNREGFVALQDHGKDFYFRNARLKEL